MKHRKLAFLAAGIALSVISCQKEEEPIDMEAPKVTLELSRNAEKLYNEVTLISTATDNGPIEKVEFFLNEQSLGVDQEAPYEVLWNTREVEDGAYVLKAVASDNAGLKAEAVQEVTVNNTLFVVNVDGSFIDENTEITQEEEWIYISDTKGNVIGDAQQVVNGKKLSWERPADFNSDTIYFNRVNYYSFFPEYYSRPSKSLIVYTYSNFALDEIDLARTNYFDKESVGSVQININNEFDESDYYIYRTSFIYRSLGYGRPGGPMGFTTDLYDEKEDAFSTYEKEVENSERQKYYRWDAFQVGNTYDFHTDEYEPMDEVNVSLPADYQSIFISTKGYKNEEDVIGFSVDNASASDSQYDQLKLFHADVFPIYRTNISFYQENTTFYINLNGTPPSSFSIPDYHSAITMNDNKHFQVNSRGTFDMGNAFWRYDIVDETQDYSIRRAIYYSSESGLNYVIPEVPASLLEIYPDLSTELSYQHSWGMDNKKLSTYEEVMTYWFTKKYDDTNMSENTSGYFYNPSQGARLLSGQTRLSPEELQNRESLLTKGILIH